MIAHIGRTRRLRVLHVLHTLGAGGAERIVCDLARRRADELDCAVACLDGLGPLAREAESLGLSVHCTGRRPGLDWRQPARLARLIRRLRPDVVHAHQYTPYLYAALAAGLARFGPVVFTEHGRHWPDVVSPRRRAINRLLRLRGDRLTAVCRFAADALVRREGLAAGAVPVVPNGVETARFERPRRHEWLAELVGAPQEAPLLIQVARFFPVKDHATSLRAFARVLSAHPQARLLLVGDGPGAPATAELARTLGIARSVHMLGLRRDVPDLLASADVFVLSSVSEAASLAILEAMSAGLPVAATDVGGNAELVVPDQTGLLSPRGDAAALAANLRRLLDEPATARRMGLAGRARARERFSQQAMHQAWVDLYRAAARGRAW